MHSVAAARRGADTGLWPLGRRAGDAGAEPERAAAARARRRADEGARSLARPTSRPRSRPTCRRGKKDDYYIFSSGGQSGQVIVIGIPSMRILKYIAVFTPEPWQGWGFGDHGSQAVLAGGDRHGHEHALGRHPPPEPVGDERRLRRPVPVHRRQGQRAHGGDQPERLRHQADRREPDPRVRSRRGLRHAQHRVRDRELAVSRRRSAAPTRRSRSTTRSTAARSTFWKFDRAKGRIDARAVVRDRAAAVHAGPRRRRQARQRRLRLHQLLQHRARASAATWKASRRSSPALRRTTWTTCTSSTGRRPRQLFEAGKTEKIDGFPVIPLETAVAEGVLHFVPEPKSPHGADVTPDGQLHRRRRQARHARHGLRLREDQGADRRQGLRRARIPTACRSSTSRSRSRARSSSGSGRCTRSSTTRATPTRRCSSSRRSRSGR